MAFEELVKTCVAVNQLVPFDEYTVFKPPHAIHRSPFHAIDLHEVSAVAIEVQFVPFDDDAIDGFEPEVDPASHCDPFHPIALHDARVINPTDVHVTPSGDDTITAPVPPASHFIPFHAMA